MNRDIPYKQIVRIFERYHTRRVAFSVDTVRWLLHLIIFNDPTTDCVVKGGVNGWYGLPKSKSLFHAKPHTGFPIGNLTSQLFSNVYLHDFDWYMKYTLGCTYYGRYVDDIVVVHHDREFLRTLVPKICTYLEQRLELAVHPNKTYLQPYTHGVAFLGEIWKPNRRYVGKRTRCSLYMFIHQWNAILIAQRGYLRTEQVLDFVSGMNSYLGSIKRVPSYRLRIKLFQQVAPTFWGYVTVNDSCTCLYKT